MAGNGWLVHHSPMTVPLCTTARLRVRHFTEQDAPFILRLLNEPTFIAHIADRGVRTLADAERYLREGPMASYAAHGHGLNCVEDLATGAAVGMCGVLRRATLDLPDLGYALLPEHAGQGLAFEAATAVMAHARDALGMRALLAIVNTTNPRSIALLERLGFRHLVTPPPAAGSPLVAHYRVEL